MKKIFLLSVLFLGLSKVSFSQAAGKGSAEKSSGGFFSRLFHKEQKPHAQMKHFDSKGKDSNMKNNGTTYKKNNSGYQVDGDGFSNGGKRKKKKGKGTK